MWCFRKSENTHDDWNLLLSPIKEGLPHLVEEQIPASDTARPGRGAGDKSCSVCGRAGEWAEPHTRVRLGCI